ncbi:hypothetical protein AQI70_06050 [Streptomyces curacoi]|uniref:Uncharacterized protein n=1 Tax=Streptomyces curacoi TaxID=146536 RepID=A0A124H5W1_9ACTN|nr:hypothetical protein AQI70_06050 [Streptomyces curacoi]
MTDQRTMTNQQILAVCRSNWEYRGIDDASVREMLDELSAHLEVAVAAGRTPQDVVGDDVKEFAASWARARAPFARRLLRTAALACCAIGSLMLISCLLRWTTERVVSVDDVAFLAIVAAVTVAWELRRGSLGFGRNLAVGLAAGLAAVLHYRLMAAVCERKCAQAVGGRVRCGPVGFLESRMWMVVGVVAISTQFEPSPL